MPYRSNRRALLLDSSEDYELILLRLCAGEGGLVRTEPEEARARFAEEAESINPDLTVLRKFEHVLISIRSEPLARALGPDPDPELTYAPPAGSALTGLDLSGLDPINDLAAIEPEVVEDEPEASGGARPGGRVAPGRCSALPLLRRRPAGDRAVRFCPHCGSARRRPSAPVATATSSPVGATVSAAGLRWPTVSSPSARPGPILRFGEVYPCPGRPFARTTSSRSSWAGAPGPASSR